MEPEEGVRPPGAGVTGEPPDMGAGNGTWVSAKAALTLRH